MRYTQTGIFNGKEEQTTGNLGYLDYGARMYDNVTGRWFEQDPLAEKYYSYSPYSYCGNNPVTNIDPDGRDWFYYKKQGENNTSWNWHDGDRYRHIYSYQDNNGNTVTTPVELAGQKAVVVFNGSRNERLGEGDNLFGKGAVLANVTVYGPKGENDIQQYKGFTMSSDSESYGIVANGDYSLNKLSENDRRGPYNSVWTVNNRGRVAAMDNYNPAYPNRTPVYLEGVFIHRSNNNGFAGKRWDSVSKRFRAVSEGCLLIVPNQWDSFHNQIKDINLLHLQIRRK